jgi:hypothetical protein
MLTSPDSDDIGAQIDLIGVLWLMIDYEPSAVPNGGYVCADHQHVAHAL